MAYNHLDARRYPLGYMWNEVRFTRRRLNANEVTRAVVMQAVVGSMFGDGKHLKKILEGLTDGE